MGLSPEGVSIPACYHPTQVFFTTLFNRATLLDFVPLERAHLIKHQTQCWFSTMHSHSFNVMSSCICNALRHCMLHVISCHMYNECYMDNAKTVHFTVYHGQLYPRHTISIQPHIPCQYIYTHIYQHLITQLPPIMLFKTKQQHP